jgi:hypothetical protein
MRSKGRALRQAHQAAAELNCHNSKPRTVSISVKLPNGRTKSLGAVMVSPASAKIKAI